MRPLIVGEQNPYGSDPGYAMYPLPERSAGGRLCSKILGMNRTTYLRSFSRTNLCPGKWSTPEARENAGAILHETPPPLILLGAKVCRAFGLEFNPFTLGQIYHGIMYLQYPIASYAILPHPSGLCRIWNEDGAVLRARQVVQAIAPELTAVIGELEAAQPTT